MGWRCWLGHSWKRLGYKISNTYAEGENPGTHLPILRETIVLSECTLCKNLKVQTIPGNWVNEDDKDDDEDGDRPKGPVKCPDDYFEMIEKRK